jgi:hypothetical protein
MGEGQQTVVETVKLKINGMYQLWGSLHHCTYMLRSKVKTVKKNEQLADHQTTHLFLVTLQSAVL